MVKDKSLSPTDVTQQMVVSTAVLGYRETSHKYIMPDTHKNSRSKDFNSVVSAGAFIGKKDKNGTCMAQIDVVLTKRISANKGDRTLRRPKK